MIAFKTSQPHHWRLAPPVRGGARRTGDFVLQRRLQVLDELPDDAVGTCEEARLFDGVK